ncbi:hypothetical protein ACHAXA_008929 [Cyclostephanos tholiformis]|uniref:protein-ribulosamine 3-kinase n=1 Tax=Cyclostephanos tholiformis TaxID=382380 RepID=A0ABD3RV09_9STRA
MTRCLLVVAIAILVPKSLAFVVTRGRPMAIGRGAIAQGAAIAPLDRELESWASSSGYGSVVTSEPAGGSDWASFRRVTVSDPPPRRADRIDDTRPVSFFVKSSTRSSREMFDGEALGLMAMYACSSWSEDDALRIPKVYRHGDYSSGSKGSYLIMEYLDLRGRSDDIKLGRAVALMHLAPPTEESLNPNGSFGFPVDNTIGGTPQPNPWTEPNSGTKEWIVFFRDHRIGHQLKLAGDSYCSNLWDNDIAPRLHLLFEDLTGEKEIRPSLLHGDLWSGNIGSADGKPSIFDPAAYWGHHEAEWGVSCCSDFMSWCAGFGPRFWEGYRSLIPQDEGFLRRKPLYDAYHQLNHYNLFGGGYINSARRDLETLKMTLNAIDK